MNKLLKKEDKKHGWVAVDDPKKILPKQKVLKIKTFQAGNYPSFDSFEAWQKRNPKLKIVDTKMFTVEKPYTELNIMVVYEAEVDSQDL